MSESQNGGHESKFPPLRVPCPSCGGKSYNEKGEYIPCYKCDSERWVMTEFGEEVLNFAAQFLCGNCWDKEKNWNRL